jgi:hypothetical protein
MRQISKACLVAAAFVSIFTGTFFTATLRADEVADWNRNMFKAGLAATPPTTPLVMSRVAAIVQASVYDAVNGIERRYAPIHVDFAAPSGASVRAAAVQAAYAALVRLYPAQTSTFDAERAASLDGISSGDAAEHSESIARGIEWGQTVADAIWTWRSGDGFTPAPPPFVGGTAVGEWRPTPPAFLPGAGPQFAYMTPWVIASPSQFRPAGPPALNSATYTKVFNETKTMGSLTSPSRTADETLYSLFWNASTAAYYWDQIALELGAERHTTLSENARLLGLVNVAMADAAIGCWEAKYHYVFWRPVTAIPLAATDGNPDTAPDPGWMPLFATPAHPEYPSGHSCVSSAAAAVLQDYFGDRAFSLTSDVMLGVTRYFTSFSDALDEVKNARVFAGIHFRTACDDGQALGTNVAAYVLGHSFQSLNGQREGQVHH